MRVRQQHRSVQAIFKPQLLKLLALTLMLLLSAQLSIEYVSARETRAQELEVQWSEPLNLSRTSGDSTLPAIAVDPFGNVHVFWLEEFRDGPRPENWVPQRGDTIYYRRFDGESWSHSLDIVATPDGSFLEFPNATADQLGFLHLVWSGERGLFYSSAYIGEATDSANDWLPSRLLIGDGRVQQPRIFLDKQGALGIVYAAVNGDGRIYNMRSEDGGDTWSAPIPISDTPSVSGGSHVSPREVVDQTGRIHVAWFESSPPDWVGHRVWYSRSDDNGISWLEPRVLAEQASIDEIQGPISLATAGSDQLIAVWVCGEVTYRCTRSSSDAGRSWGPLERIFGHRNSRAGWDALVADASGSAYLIVQLRATDIPQAVYYSAFSDSRWIDPPIPVITEGPLVTAHHPQMSVSQGNQLHVVLEAYGESEIYYMTATTTAPPSHSLAQLPKPAQATPFAATPTMETTVVNIVTPTPVLGFTDLAEERVYGKQYFFLSIIPAVLLVITVVGLRFSRREG